LFVLLIVLKFIHSPVLKMRNPKLAESATVEFVFEEAKSRQDDDRRQDQDKTPSSEMKKSASKTLKRSKRVR
jgi:hypothetical protein